MKIACTGISPEIVAFIEHFDIELDLNLNDANGYPRFCLKFLADAGSDIGKDVALTESHTTIKELEAEIRGNFFEIFSSLYKGRGNL